MLCMHELAFTRSEPEAKMNIIQLSLMLWKFSITLLRVTGKAIQRHSLWRVTHFKSIWVNQLLIIYNRDYIAPFYYEKDYVHVMIPKYMWVFVFMNSK